MSAVPEPVLRELSRRHRVSYEQARHSANQVYAWYTSSDLPKSNEEFERRIRQERTNGNYHLAAILWFVQTAKTQGICLDDTIDLYVALGHGDNHNQ